MSGDRKPTTFAERSLARALARDAKRARKAQWRQFSLPGSRNFNLIALPPYVELRRHGDGWLLRYQPPRSRP